MLLCNYADTFKADANRERDLVDFLAKFSLTRERETRRIDKSEIHES